MKWKKLVTIGLLCLLLLYQLPTVSVDEMTQFYFFIINGSLCKRLKHSLRLQKQFYIYIYFESKKETLKLKYK